MGGSSGEGLSASPKASPFEPPPPPPPPRSPPLLLPVAAVFPTNDVDDVRSRKGDKSAAVEVAAAATGREPSTRKLAGLFTIPSPSSAAGFAPPPSATVVIDREPSTRMLAGLLIPSLPLPLARADVNLSAALGVFPPTDNLRPTLPPPSSSLQLPLVPRGESDRSPTLSARCLRVPLAVEITLVVAVVEQKTSTAAGRKDKQEHNWKWAIVFSCSCARTGGDGAGTRMCGAFVASLVARYACEVGGICVFVASILRRSVERTGSSLMSSHNVPYNFCKCTFFYVNQ